MDWTEDVLWWCEVCVYQNLTVYCHSKDSCVQWVQDPLGLTFNVISIYGLLSVPYISERHPEDDDLLVETYIGA
jgi:hypothetical protein